MFLAQARALALASALSGAPAGEPVPKIEAFVLDVESVPRTELREALELRLPGRPKMRSGNPKAREGYKQYAYISIRRDGDGWALTLILADGRSYYRPLEGEAELVPRIAASTIANLVAGIEADTLRPDDEDVPIPDEAPPEPVAPAPKPKPKPKPRPRPELGVRLGGGVVLGAGSTAPTGFAAGGGELGVLFRGLNGGLAGLGFRGGGRSASGFGLARFRISVVGGYAFRRGAFELVVAGGAAAEPWFVQRGGDREALVAEESGEERRSSFLLGGFARVAPGYRAAFSRTAAFAISPVLEVGGSAVPAREGGVVGIRAQGDDPELLFRVGGLEFWAGLELGFWFSVPGGTS